MLELTSIYDEDDDNRVRNSFFSFEEKMYLQIQKGNFVKVNFDLGMSQWFRSQYMVLVPWYWPNVLHVMNPIKGLAHSTVMCPGGEQVSSFGDPFWPRIVKLHY